MNSILVFSENNQKIKNYILEFCSKKKIGDIDVSYNSFEKVVGIDDVRNIKKSSLLKPFRSKEKAIIIHANDGITIEAQNALLKTLEEPPANTFIIVTVANKELVLPTILSRCKTIALKDEKREFNSTSTSELNHVLDILKKGKTGERLKIAEQISQNKEQALAWLQNFAFFIQDKLVSEPSCSKLLKRINRAYSLARNTNVNTRIIIENLLL